MWRMRADSGERLDHIKKYAMARAGFERLIKWKEEEEEDDDDATKTYPRFEIVMYHDLLEKLWGWDRLVPMGALVSLSDYSHYLEAYYHKTNSDAKSVGIGAIIETCVKKEEELVSEWKVRKISKMEMILPMSKSIILSCLIHQCASSVIYTANSKLSAVSIAALWCITKEAELTHELLTRGAHPYDDYLIDQGSEIRMCALSLMNCTSHNSSTASGAMLGIAKEAEMMCEWMSKNDLPIDFCDDPIPEEIVDSRFTRFRTLNVMFNMLGNSTAAASGGGDGGSDYKIAVDANTAGGSISDELNSLYLKIEGGNKSSKRKRNKDDDLDIQCDWERILLLCDGAEWSKYSKYLAAYCNQSAYEFLADAVSKQNLGCSLPAVVADRCLKMEEELTCIWKHQVPYLQYDTLSISTIVLSSLVKEHVLAIWGTKGEFSVSSAIAFMCITYEADLMRELLNHGVPPINDIIQQSIVIRMCALGLVNLTGQQSIASTAAMVGMAKETKRMSDDVKRDNRLLKGILSKPGGRVIRSKTLDLMINILLDSTFPNGCYMMHLKKQR